MSLSLQVRNKRRALIVRRQAAYLAGQAQLEKRQGAQSDDVGEATSEGDLLAELPDGLIG